MPFLSKSGAPRKEIAFMRPAKNALPKRKRTIVYDIESKKESESLWQDSQKAGFARGFLVSLFDGKNEYTWRNEKNVMDYPWEQRALIPGGIIDKTLTALLVPEYCSKKARIYAHNGGKFDHIFLLAWIRLHSDEFCFEIVDVQSKIQRLDIWRKDTDRKKLSWSFLDSLSIIPLSLKKACKTFGLDTKDSKKEIDLDLHEDDESWEAYGIQDVKSLYIILDKFHKLVESLGGEVGLTAPSTSMKLFMRRYLKRPIHRHKHFKNCDGTCRDEQCERKQFQSPDGLSSLCDGHCHGCLHAWMLSCYYGGRSEVFIKYGKGLRYYDINSSYPRAMLELMPVGQKIELNNPTLKQCREWQQRGYIGTLECDVFIPRSCKIPPLPHRHDGKLKFTIGHMTGIWGLAELELLFEPEVNGRIEKIRKAVFIKGEKIFADMVHDIYAYRDKKSPKYVDDGLSFICKLILNSLYGKFGMSPMRSAVIYVDRENGDLPPMCAMPAHGDPIHDVIWKIPYFVDIEYMIPQIARHITDLARIRLFQGMLKVMRAGGKVFYVDTDSMRVDIEIEEGSRLGEWKEEEVFCTCLHKRDDHNTDNPKRPCKQCNCASFVRGNVLENENILPKLGRLTQHTLNCDDDMCKGCLFVYEDANGKSASKQYMKGIPMKSQTSRNFDDLVYEKKELPIERVRQFKGVINSWGNPKAKALYLTPGLIQTSKSHRTIYDKRYVLPNGDTMPFFVDKEKN